MSRLTHKHYVGEKVLEVAYGYDFPLQEYFIQVFDPNIEDEDQQCIVDEGNFCTGKSNIQMYHLFKDYGVPYVYLACVLNDVPIVD